jgi:NAD(P)-dependent dehydrogenase (short-subunit alcohol dehydrogenase family)
LSTAEWRKIIDINLTGVFLVIKAMLPLMKNAGWGRIINIGSGSVFAGVPSQAHYVAAKAGVIGLSRSLAREVGNAGITVNVVAPGLTVTPAVRKNFPAQMLQAAIGSRAIKREEVAEDLVGTVFFLASPDADFISGQTISVDGGRHML